jgi:DNA-binding Lrp family transcriptional regulator
MVLRKRVKMTMFKTIKRGVMKMFREFLVYHHSSLEFRAKILTLVVSSNGEICACEERVLEEIAHRIYMEDDDRATLLVDTVYEYHHKIVTSNGLEFEHLVQHIAQEIKKVKRFCNKIAMSDLKALHECTSQEDEEAWLFQERILEFLESLQTECKERI